MSFLLLWIETLLVIALLVALMIALASRQKRYFARLSAGALAFLPAIPLAILFFFGFAMRFIANLSGAIFWSTLLLIISYIVVAYLIRRAARRPDSTGIPRAQTWPLPRIAIAFLIALSLLGMTFWNLSLQSQVEIQTLRAQAGALALSVAPPQVADSANAAILYDQANIAFVAASIPADDKIEYRELDPRAPEVTAYLQRHQKTLDLVRRGADLPQCRPDFDYTQPSLDVVPLGPYRNYANLLAVAAKSQAASGKPDLALDDCRRMYALGAHASAAPLLISGLVTIAIDSLASKTIGDVLPFITTADQLSHLPASDPNAVTRAYLRALRGDEAYGIAAYCDFATGTSATYVLPAPYSGQSGLIWMLWMKEDLFIARDNLRRIRSLAAEPFYKNAAEIKQLQSESNSAGGRGFLAAIMLPSTAHTLSLMTEAQALRSVTNLAAAATRYRLAKGGYPASAQELVPDYIDAIPLDPFDGKPIRYKKTDAGITLYSVGRDLTDNNGDVESKPKQTARPADTGIILRLTPRFYQVSPAF